MGQPVNPPDGWRVEENEGVWGVDFQRDDTLSLTSAMSIKMVGTAAQTQTFIGSWIPIDANGVAYVATAVVRATNTTSLFTLKLEIYAADKTTLLDTVALYQNQSVGSANVWQTASMEFSTITGYTWGRFILTRSAGATATVNVDRVEIKKLGPRWAIRKTGAAQTLLATSFVNFETADYANLVTAATASVRVFRAGIYLLRFQARITGLASGDYVTAFFRINHPLQGQSDFGECIFASFPVGGGFQSYVNVIGSYRHAGTSGGGTVITCGLYYSGTSPTAAIATGGGEHSALTAFTGTWIGVG